MSGMFGSQQAAPVAAPTPKPPATMPDVDSEGVREARRKAQLDIMGRAGRQSTILTAPKDRLADYTSRALGAG